MCEHHNFAANVAINRMEDIGKFAADVTIKCTDCDLPFQFVGLPTGLNMEGAAVSVDATEARLPIVPYGQANTILSGILPIKNWRVITPLPEEDL